MINVVINNRNKDNFYSKSGMIIMMRKKIIVAVLTIFENIIQILIYN